MTLTELAGYNCSTIRTQTPDGTMFVTIIEDNNSIPVEILVSIGKTGTRIRAWTEAVQGLCTTILSLGGKLTDIANSIDNISTDDRYETKSGPEGLVKCIAIYLKSRADLIKEHESDLPKLEMPWI